MSIKDVPMATADEHDISLNQIVFTIDWDSGYGFERQGKFSIEALRIISVDNTRRFFRARCIKGCEMEFSYAKGCDRRKVYGDIQNARNAVSEKIVDDLVKCNDKIVKVEQTKQYLEEVGKDLKKFKPREPKKIP